MQNRRDTLRHGAVVAGLLGMSGMFPQFAWAAWNTKAFDAKTLPESFKALGITPAESKDVTLTAPDIAENGAVVPFGASTTVANPKQIIFLVEKNPQPLTAVFNMNENLESNVSTRCKMGQSSDVYAVVITADGKALYAKKEVKVTLGGCGG